MRANHSNGHSLDGEALPEPFRAKMVEPIRLLPKPEREQRLAEAGHNLFRLKADDVFVDLLTDSGTSAMSDSQWAALMRADPAYAGSRPFHDLARTVNDVFGYDQFLPVHQGRAAEHLLAATLAKPGDVIPSNHHFDTTRANLAAVGAKPVDFPCRESLDPDGRESFKGNMDTERLEELLASRAHVPFVMLTITDNAGGGQPVSLANIRRVHEIANGHRVPLILDSCRFAENAWFVREREPGQATRPIPDIVRDIFAAADGFTFSAKKDGLANMGGLLGLRSPEKMERLRQRLILVEGFPTYGGMSARDMATVAVGIREAIEEAYLRSRIRQVGLLHRWLSAYGVPVVRPAGGHAVYVNAGRMLPHVAPEEFPGHALACALYREGGIRSCEIGSLMFDATPDDATAGGSRRLELTRLAIPRRVYSDNHLDYVARTAIRILESAHDVHGLRITQAPASLRHFSARLQPL
ncbi:MAG: tryptophanase [Euryarchaeota archaeon]|nr:tryptophanase [Euryarchaeota archaeon]